MKQEVTLKTIDIKINHSYKKFQLWRSPEEIMQLLYIDHCIVNVWKQSGEMFLCFHKTGFKLNLRICCFYFEKKNPKTYRKPVPGLFDTNVSRHHEPALLYSDWLRLGKLRGDLWGPG